jgi:ketosteroid isomerase-like protein
MLRMTLRIAIVCLTTLGLVATMPETGTAQASDIEQVKVANKAYYDALSARDLTAMERVWAPTAQVVNIAPPVRPAAHAGWGTIRKNYIGFWGTLDELTVSMADPEIRIHGSVAWIYGIEQTKRRAKDGTVSGGSNIGTSIFIKDNNRWLMVFH